MRRRRRRSRAWPGLVRRWLVVAGLVLVTAGLAVGPAAAEIAATAFPGVPSRPPTPSLEEESLPEASSPAETAERRAPTAERRAPAADPRRTVEEESPPTAAEEPAPSAPTGIAPVPIPPTSAPPPPADASPSSAVPAPPPSGPPLPGSAPPPGPAVEPEQQPPAAAGPPSAQPAGSVLTLTPDGGSSPAGTTVTFVATVTPPVPGGSLSLTVEGTGEALEVSGSGGVWTGTYTTADSLRAPVTRTVRADWTGPGGELPPRLTRSASHTWIPGPDLTLTQSSGSSQVGSELTVLATVENGASDGTLTLAVNGVLVSDPSRDGELYAHSYTRQDPGRDEIVASWRQPGLDPVVRTVVHEWTPAPPTVVIAQDLASSPAGSVVGVTVRVTGGLAGGSLAVVATGANGQNLRVTGGAGGTYTASYAGVLAGSDTIRAVWTQDGRQFASDPIVHTVTPRPELLLTASEAESDLGRSVVVTALLPPPEGEVTLRSAVQRTVVFDVGGPNARRATVVGDRTFTFEYLGLSPGTDTVVASIDGPGGPVSNTVVIRWRTPAVTLDQAAASSLVGETATVTATVTGVVGPVTFQVAGVNVDAALDQGGEGRTYALRYRGSREGTDEITASVVVGGRTYTSPPITHRWGRAAVVVSQSTAASEFGQRLELTATVDPPQPAGAVVFSVAGAGASRTLRDDTPADGYSASFTREPSPYTSGPRVDTITAAWEGEGARFVSAEISHEWRTDPVPAVVVSPGGTSSCTGAPFAATVTVTDDDPVPPGLAVQLTTTMPNAAAPPLTGSLGPDGRSTLTYRRDVAGVETLVATAQIDGRTVSSAPVTHTWQDCALTVTLTPAGATTTSGSGFTPTVAVTDATGAPVAGAAVALRAVMDGRPDVVRDLTTAADGTASTEYSRDAPGTDRITAVVTDGRRSGTATVEHGWTAAPARPEVRMSLSPAGTSSAAGSPFTITATVTEDGRPRAGVRVTFTARMPDQADVAPLSTVTDADGQAPFTYTRPGAGTDTVGAAATVEGGLVTATAAHRWTLGVGPPGSGEPSISVAPAGGTSPVGTDFTPVAVVRDGDRPAADAEVAFTATMTGAEEIRGTVRTDAEGRAPFPYRRLVPGTDTVSATVRLGDRPATASVSHQWRSGDVVRSPVPEPTLRVEPPKPLPGSTATVLGTRCPPGSPVQVRLGDRPLGTTTADGAGAFAVPVRVPGLSVGRHVLVVSCPPVRVEKPLDVVVETSSNGTSRASATTAVAVLSFFVLVGGQLVRLGGGGYTAGQ